MIFPFFIKQRQLLLRSRLDDLAKKRIGVNTKALTMANESYRKFAMHTKSSWNWFKSFIPGTFSFNLRLECASAIANANSKINEAVKAKKAINKSASPTRNQSNPEVYLQREQYATVFSGSNTVPPYMRIHMPKAVTVFMPQ